MDECIEHINIHTKEYLICKNCGHVSEYTIFPKEDDCNPDSIFSWVPKGSRSIVTKDGKMMNKDVNNLHKQMYFSSRKKIENNIMDTIYNFVEIPDVIKKSTFNYWLMIKGCHKGNIRTGLLACCLYYSCIKYKCPRTPGEICSLFKDLNLPSFHKSDKIFMSLFEQDVYGWSDVSSYILRYLSEMDMDNKISNFYEIYKECCMVKYNGSGNRTNNIALAIIYYKCRDFGVNKKYMTNKFSISYPTINKILKSIENDNKIF